MKISLMFFLKRGIFFDGLFFNILTLSSKFDTNRYPLPSKMPFWGEEFGVWLDCLVNVRAFVSSIVTIHKIFETLYKSFKKSVLLFLVLRSWQRVSKLS